MATEEKTYWTVTTLTDAFHKYYQEKKLRQICVHVSTHRCNWIVYDNRCCWKGTSENHTLPKENGMQIVGQSILKLSKMQQYDRIIELEINGESPDLYKLFKPLLNDEFTSLINLKVLGHKVGRASHFSGMNHVSTYNAICDMIGRDKFIGVVLGFNSFDSGQGKSEIYDVKQKRFLIDTSKLTDSLKTTNTLKEIILPPPNSISGCCCEKDRCGGPEHCNPQCDYDLHDLLKESLRFNLSVISVIAHSNYGGDIVIDKDSKSDNRATEATISSKLLSKYQEWWPQIQKRNTEAQTYNKILFGDEKEDGTWNNNICPHQIGLKTIKTHFPSIPALSFDNKGDRCFCVKCHTKRKDRLIYKRGKPPKRYALPVEWVRYGLKTDESKCLMNKVWSDWHVAFHGTTKEVVPLVFKAGLLLLKPGDYAIDGSQLGIRGGHITKSFKRYNKYTKENETFDPNQIYVSPSIKYSGHGAYAKSFLCSHPQDRNRTVKVQFAFQLRIRPGSYSIGQETVGAASQGKTLDENFSNNELEWYTKENIGIVLHGLLVRIKEINVPLSKYKKGVIKVDDEKKEDK
eukprot:383699_1